MKLVNLTGHDINVVSQIDGQWTVTKTLLSQGCARVSFTTTKVDEIDGIDVFRTVFGETINLPNEENDTMFIVSKIVAEANPNRDDLLIVSETVRDGATIIGCKGLSKL